MDSYLGSIFLFAGSFAPQGSLFCNGQLLAISSNTALFSILGTTYGGNGTTTFAIPDLRGRAPVSSGQLTGGSNYYLGEMTGAETVTLQTSQLPPHTHVAMASSNAANQPSPAGNYWSAGPATTGRGATTTNAYSSTSNSPMAAGAISTTGNGQAVSVLQPLLVINYCIVTQGIYPPRP